MSFKELLSAYMDGKTEDADIAFIKNALEAYDTECSQNNEEIERRIEEARTEERERMKQSLFLGTGEKNHSKSQSEDRVLSFRELANCFHN